jgi:hypothetical protein
MPYSADKAIKADVAGQVAAMIYLQKIRGCRRGILCGAQVSSR